MKAFLTVIFHKISDLLFPKEAVMKAVEDLLIKEGRLFIQLSIDYIMCLGLDDNERYAIRKIEQMIEGDELCRKIHILIF